MSNLSSKKKKDIIHSYRQSEIFSYEPDDTLVSNKASKERSSYTERKRRIPLILSTDAFNREKNHDETYDSLELFEYLSSTKKQEEGDT